MERVIVVSDSRKSMATHRLDPLLKPFSIALLGASARPESMGKALVDMCRIDGYRGRIYPVNPRYQEIDDLRCYPALQDLPERVDHVVIALGNHDLESALDAAISHGARAATIFGSAQIANDFTPSMSQRLKQRAVAANLALCGPNSMGLYSPLVGLRVTGFISSAGLRSGGTAFIAQSGSIFSALAHNDRRFGFSLCVSSGMELTTTASEYAEWALQQPQTRVIALFLEQVRDPGRFGEVLEAANRRDIPVVILKVGRTARSAEMALSHTGALAGSDAAFGAFCRHHGAVLVDDLDEMAATLLFFDQQHKVTSGKLASMHDSGGERELVTDLADRLDVPFAEISDATRAAIAPNLDTGLLPDNPLDAWGTPEKFVQRYTAAFKALVDDPDVAAGVFFSDIRENYWYSTGVIEAVQAVAKEIAKPIVIATNYSKTFNHDLAARLAGEGLPVLEGTRESLLAVRHAFQWRDRKPAQTAPTSVVNLAVVERWQRRLASGEALSESDSLGLLNEFGVSVCRALVAETSVQACDGAARIGFPVALKTAAGHAHKSEVRGVHLGLASALAVAEAYGDLASRLGPEVLVCEMVPRGVEIGVGAIVDPAFGPIIIVSSGGTLIEILRDKAAGMAPLGPDAVRDLLTETKVYKLLSGVRGAPPADIDALSQLISRFSIMVAALAPELSEVDVNPVICGSWGARAVDALIIPKERH